MGSSYKEERDARYGKVRKILKTCTTCLALFSISTVGALMLVWWTLKYHPTNSQMWLVPFGLIILITPLIACFSAFFSDFCSPKDAGVSILNNPVMPVAVGNSVPDLER